MTYSLSPILCKGVGEGGRKEAPFVRHRSLFARVRSGPIGGLHRLLLVALLSLGSSSLAVGRSQQLANPEAVQERSFSVFLPTKDQAPGNVRFLVELTPETAGPGEEVTLVVVATIKPDWHIGAAGIRKAGAPSIPTTIRFGGDSLIPLGKAFSASVEPEVALIGGVEHRQHSRAVTWERKYRVAEGAARPSGSGSIRFQACDANSCLPPSLLEFSLGGEVPVAPPVAAKKMRPYKTVGAPIRLALSGSKLERSLINYTALITADPEEDFDRYVKQLMKAMGQTEKLPLRAEFTRDGSSVAIYLAEREQYPLVNSSKDDTRYGNTSTFVSIDHDGDGKIVDYESVPSNLPIRLFDSMFLVTEIDKASQTITLQELNLPLAGAILGRKCPDFWYETVEGRVVSNITILGAVTILDIWGVT